MTSLSLTLSRSNIRTKKKPCFSTNGENRQWNSLPKNHAEAKSAFTKNLNIVTFILLRYMSIAVIMKPWA